VQKILFKSSNPLLTYVNVAMNRLIQLCRQQALAPFQISISRDDRAYCGYAVHCFRKPFTPLTAARGAALRSRQITQDFFPNEFSVRKLYV
jgi:hypothetical protein